MASDAGLVPRASWWAGTAYLVAVDNVTYFPKTLDYFQCVSDKWQPKTFSFVILKLAPRPRYGRSGRTSGALVVSANGAVSGSAGYMPTDTYWSAANFWVDGEKHGGISQAGMWVWA